MFKLTTINDPNNEEYTGDFYLKLTILYNYS